MLRSPLLRVRRFRLLLEIEKLLRRWPGLRRSFLSRLVAMRQWAGN